MAVAIQPAMPRPVVSSPVPIASARPTIPQRDTSDKENAGQLKPTTATVAGLANIRSRRERPCDACRRRKSRCVINPGASICVLCDFHKQSCTFLQDPQPRKRKVPAPDQKDANSKKRSIHVPSPQILRPQQKFAPKLVHTPTSRPVRPVENKILGESLGLQSSRHGRHLGLSSPFEPLLIGLSTFDSRNESILSLGTLRKVNDHETFIMQPDDATQDYADEVEALDAISRIVSPHGPALLDIYFQIVHPCFPVIQKHVLLVRMRQGERNFAPALLAGMYLLALNWWNYDSKLSKHSRPNIEQLDAIASKSLTAAMQRPKLSTVQAGLLLLQRPEADSWSLTTQLVAVGQELGLHLDCSDWEIPQWEKSLRKRIAWALYMQDKWSSLIHGRPSHIFAANWAVGEITEDDTALDNQVNPNFEPPDEKEKADMEQGHVLFSQMIDLTGIMAEVMDTFYTQAAIQDFAKAGSKSTEMILERAKPVQIKLKDWFTRLPPCVRMDSLEKGKLAPSGFLHLAYFATEITLHRRIVQSLKHDVSKPYLVYICRSAAKTRLISAMDFINRLRPEHLQAFWYFPSKINFTLIGTFGGLLCATAPAREEAEFYKTRLREYRWTLSVSSNRAQFLEYAVQMLDASRAMLRNMAEKPSLAQSHINSMGVPDKSMSRVLSASSTQQQMEDVAMTDDTPPLTRTTSLSNASVSAFSGFSMEALDQYSASSRDDEDGDDATTPVNDKHGMM